MPAKMARRTTRQNRPTGVSPIDPRTLPVPDRVKLALAAAHRLGGSPVVTADSLLKARRTAGNAPER